MRSFFEAISVSCVIPAQSPADDERTVFENLSFAVERGEIVDLVGPSGSGKSSLLTACARLNRMRTARSPLRGRAAARVRRSSGGRSSLPAAEADSDGQNVAEVIAWPWTLAIRGKGGKAEQLLESAIRMRWAAVRIDLGARPARPVRRAETARVALARTLLTDPKVLLADEVDAGLDRRQRSQGGYLSWRCRHTRHGDHPHPPRPPDGRGRRR